MNIKKEIQCMEVGKVNLSSKAKYWKNKAAGLRKLLLGVSIAMYALGILSGAFIITFI